MPSHRETGLADNRRDVDDAAALLIDHTLHEGARGQEQAETILTAENYCRL